VLHLLGHDDHDSRKAARMHRMEDEILSGVGLGAVYDPRSKR
jgi:ssRNA-specific RNase YbeY (16S rRNA maturation enzyme)